MIPAKPTIFIFLCTLLSCKSSPELTSVADQQIIVTSDINNFWNAYDSIQKTQDSIAQLELIDRLFLKRASVGQKQMVEARRYTPEGYLATMTNRTKFWNSIRKNTENLDGYNQAIKNGVDQLATIYPDLKLSTIYYTMGNHRSPGTGVDSIVMLGTEFALGDTLTHTADLPEHLQNYYTINPIDHLAFLCVHEYVHTQQGPMVHDLLSLTLYEGIAEFVAIKATGHQSPWKAFTYGPENEEKIKQRFEEDMFKPNSIYNWLWNSPQNEFGTRDLSYFVGFQVANQYYKAEPDKKAAIKTLIELDYNDEMAVRKLVDGTQYFSNTLDKLETLFDDQRPTVTSIKQFENNTQNIDPNLTVITLNFSEPMNPQTRGFDYGPLGEDHVLSVQDVIGYDKDHKSFSFTVKLESDKQYQSTITDRFLSEKGYPLKPFVIDFKTQ